MTGLLIKACMLYKLFTTIAEKFESVVLLGIRLWMGEIFLMSGLNKLNDYMNGNGDSVLYLFQEIHPVPLLPAEIAAPLGTAGEVGLGALLIVGLNVLHGFFTYLRGKWTAEASECIVRSLRHELYQHLERIPCSYHDKADTGDLVQRCSSDVETLRVFLASQVVEIARVALFFLIAAPIMFSQDFRMSLLSLGVIPLIVIVALLFFPIMVIFLPFFMPSMLRVPKKRRAN